jgi:hypothetical protein
MHHGELSGLERETPSVSTWRDPAESGAPIASATTEPSGSSSGGHSSSVLDSTLQSDSSSENGHVRIIKRLEKEVESFRNDRSTKTSTIAAIISILGENTEVEITPPQRESTFDTYLTEILAIESSRDNAPSAESAGVDPSVRPVVLPSSKGKPNARKRKESAESDSEDEGDKSAKKPKLHESDLPWFESSEQSSSANHIPNGVSNPSCDETRRLLRTYNLDVAKAKFSVKIASKSPRGFPSSQWERILKGDAVDLNQVFSALHHVVPDEERTGRLGDAEISFGVSEPKRRISTAAEWSVAWRRASKAISFAFPHRREELLEYGDYIESEFAAKVSSSHHKLLLYDIALRNEVAAGQHILLTDFSRFTRLYSAIVLPDGIEGSSEGSNSRKPSKPKGSDKPELCNKFNSGTCKRPDAECKYRHLCKLCGKSGHGSKDCSSGS